MTTLPPPQLGHRTLYPDLQHRVYLAHAAVSPVSAPVRAAVNAVLDDYARLGSGAFPPWIQQRQRLKETVAHLLNCEPSDLALMQSTTAGVMALALCLDWQPGERVVLTEGEFPANVTPWQQAAKHFGLEIIWLPRPDPHAIEPWLSALANVLRRGARLVALSAVQFQTGLRMPLAAIAELCQATGTELAIDAVQAFGAIPLDVQQLGIDYLATGAHKWAGGVEGAGFLYVAPERIGRIQQRMAGWLSHEDGIGFLFRGAGLLLHDRPIRKTADFLEIGNLSTASFAALGAAVEILAALDVTRIFLHVQPILDALESGLVARGFTSMRAADVELRSCTLSLLPPADVDVLLLAKDLTGQGIAVSVPDGFLRLAPHWSNHLDEVPVVLAAIDRAIAQQQSAA